MACNVSLVIPHYNEAERLQLMEDGLVEFAKACNGLQVEALLVDDGSRDETLSGLKKTAADFPGKYGVAPEAFSLRAIALEQNSGKGAALQRLVFAFH